MKKNLKMELLNSEVEQQVQGGAGRFAADFTMPGGDLANAILMSETDEPICAMIEACATLEIGGCHKFYRDKRGGCSGGTRNYIACWDYEVSDGCNGHPLYIRPKDDDNRIMVYGGFLFS